MSPGDSVFVYYSNHESANLSKARLPHYLLLLEPLLAKGARVLVMVSACRSDDLMIPLNAFCKSGNPLTAIFTDDPTSCSSGVVSLKSLPSVLIGISIFPALLHPATNMFTRDGVLLMPLDLPHKREEERQSNDEGLG